MEGNESPLISVLRFRERNLTEAIKTQINLICIAKQNRTRQVHVYRTPAAKSEQLDDRLLHRSPQSLLFRQTHATQDKNRYRTFTTRIIHIFNHQIALKDSSSRMIHYTALRTIREYLVRIQAREAAVSSCLKELAISCRRTFISEVLT